MLNQREKRIISLRKQGYTYDEIGKLLGLTRQRVHQIFKKLSQRIKV